MTHFLRRHQLALIISLAALPAVWLYWPVIQLPLSFDDLLHIRLVEEFDYFSVWLPTSDFPFYRPFLFLPLLFIRSLFGFYPSRFLYAFNLLLHVLNTALLVWLVWRLSPRWTQALAAGILFASYPFSYQVVAVFGNNIYPLLVLIILAALHTYLLARHGRRLWWVVTAVLFLMGMLSHELMVLFGFFAGLVQWVDANKIEIGGWQPGSHQWRQLLEVKAILRNSPFIIFILICGFYLISYRFLPVGVESLPQPVAGNPLSLRILYLLQSALYPLVWFTNRLPGFSAERVLGIGLLLFIGLTAVAARRPSNRLTLLLGWGWWGLVTLLLTLTLPTNYLLHSPRLTYLGSIGVAILLALFLDELFRRSGTGRLAWALFLVAILIVSGWFVRGRVGALADLGSVIPLFTEVMASRPAGEGVLLVNLPAWRSPLQKTFPVGVEHVALMGDHLFVEELVWDNLNQVRPVLAVTVPELLQTTDYSYGLHGQVPAPPAAGEWAPAGAHVFINSYADSGVEATYTGHFGPPSQPTAPLALFGPYQLLAARVVLCNETISVSTTWQVDGTVPATSSLFVQAVAGDGRLLAQQDGPPLNLSPGSVQIPVDWQIQDIRTLAPVAASQEAQLVIGAYDYVTGTRFPGSDERLNQLPDDALRLPLAACDG